MKAAKKTVGNPALKKFKYNLSWNEKAKANPLYAIMSHAEFQELSQNDLDESNVKKFYEKGEWLWKQFIESTISEIPAQNNSKVLEWGCGMGRLLVNASKKGLECFGVDISEEQLKLLQKYYPYFKLPQTVLYTNNQHVNLPDNSFDFIYSYAVLQHIKSTKELIFVVKEMLRLLAKGGTLLFQCMYVNSISAHFKLLPLKTINFNNFTLLFYLRKISFFYFPVVRITGHNNWSGAGHLVPLKKYCKLINEHGSRVVKVEFLTDENKMVWITAKK